MRRRFLKYLLSSPLLLRGQVADPKEAINVLDFEAAAQKALPPAHFGYMATGVDDDATLRANRQGFSKLYLRPRRLVDIRKVDTRTEVCGLPWDCPIALAPVGNMGAFHSDAELHVARAAKARNVVQFLSTYTNTPIREVVEARGAPVWYQLYPQLKWDITERLVRMAEEAGSPAIALTVDTQAGRRAETQERFRVQDKRDCTVCHGPATRRDFYRRKAMFADMDKGVLGGVDQGMTWEQVRKLRKLTTRKLLIKGIETAEDARLCVENGLDGMVVSNHGGRASDAGRGTIECLPEVVDAVGGRATVLVDGGFRRGTDVFKALALGAKGVLVGRPYIWGVSAFGQPGVERVIEMLRGEFELVMKQCGVTSVAGITSAYIGRH